MNYVLNYIDELMVNQPLNSEEDLSQSPVESIQSGGKLIIEKGFGGFPPIHLCEKKISDSPFEEEEKPKREYSKHKAAVSIETIMEKRRKEPFISLTRLGIKE